MSETVSSKILIVDDERDMTHFLSVRLRSRGYDVSTASDGREALSQIKKNRPDLVLLDVMMPKFNGYEVCRYLKQDEDTKNIPIIFLTARDQIQDRVLAKESGADDFLSKPFEGKLLVNKVENWLKEKK